MQALLFLWLMIQQILMANSISTTINLQRGRGKCWQTNDLRSRRLPRVSFGTCLSLLLCCWVGAWAQPAESGGAKAQPSRAYNPVFPFDALIAGHPGWAEVSFTVDNNGRATFLSTVGSSDAAFASAFQAEIEAIEFSPPRINGRPMTSQLKERFDFSGQPALDAVARGILAELRKQKPAIYAVDELDKKPEPIRQPQPAYPWVLRSDGVSGQAEIEVVIDRTGRPLFPRIVSSTNEDFGWAAATVVQRWRYQPPVKNGEKVDARLKVTVSFDINKAADMW
jgi:TonB family protein